MTLKTTSFFSNERGKWKSLNGSLKNDRCLVEIESNINLFQ